MPLGFLCGAAFIFFARPTPRALLIGASVSLLGLALRAWAAGHIRKNAQLATSGPYAFTRNPLYLGSFLLGLGFTIASGRVILGLLFAALFLGIYLPVMRVEASHVAAAPLGPGRRCAASSDGAGDGHERRRAALTAARRPLDVWTSDLR